uniref:Uncharacterized protein n=1 Tax=Anguilla anguilla TaxID=7936 RepID=A0A0E9PQG6_ANGAN
MCHIHLLWLSQMQVFTLKNCTSHLQTIVAS